MNLSGFLQSQDFLESLPHRSSDELRDYVFSKGRDWFDAYPEKSMVIVKNLSAFGMQYAPAFLKQVQTHILLHYYEKLLPLCLSPRDYHKYLTDRIRIPPEIENLKNKLSENKGLLLAVCHFGAVELIGPTLAANGLPFTGVLRFATKNLSAAAKNRSQELAATGLFVPIGFVEIGNAQSPAALEMAAVLRRGGILLTAFDEKTEYSVPVTLKNRQVWGGAGLDKLVKFAQADVPVWTAFAVRNNDETYDMRLFEMSHNKGGIVQAMYASLESLLVSHCAQWYFLHEEIPFVQ
jgi:lauroyl/myristoyl acyltransferase